MQVPFIDLRVQYARLKSEIDDAILKVLSAGRFSGGEVVRDFENQFSAEIGVKHCVAVANGTDALLLSLKAIGVGANDEVITPAWSWISSSECISHCNAKIVFADADPDLYTISVEEVAKKITARTKAVIAVHLYGQAAPAFELLQLCIKNNITLIEDCAQAHFTKVNNAFAGTIGKTGAFSFYPTKNLGAYGEAGVVITNDDAIATRIRRLSNHGALERNDNEFEGFNSRIDTIQAAILSVKLKHIHEWNERRRKIAAFYSSQLSGIERLITPAIRPGSVHTFHLYVVRTKERDKLKEYLEGKGIQTLIHYPRAIPNLPAYAYIAHKPADFPVSSALEKEVLSLPVYPELSESEVQYICDSIREFFDPH